jgi:FtsH-binding integral membrane protein
MKHRLLKTLAVFASTAVVFAGLDLYGVSFEPDATILLPLAAHVLVLTVVVGAWLYAMSFLDPEQPGAPSDGLSHAAP